MAGTGVAFSKAAWVDIGGIARIIPDYIMEKS